MAQAPQQAGPALGSRAVELLQRLIRFDTVNPPGNEGEAQRFLFEILDEAGWECEILAKDPERPNLVARLRGREDGPSAGPDLPRRHRPRRPGRVDARPLGR